MINAEISARLLDYVSNGASLKEAFGYVLGPGYYDCLIEEIYTALEEIYTELRAKATGQALQDLADIGQELNI